MQEQDWDYFRKGLLDWYDPHRRPMPWKAVADPYLIWLSEIILQQTRVEQGMPYYERFAAAYPRVTDLAAANDDAVMKLWEGLGYYSRARNLLRTARMVTADYGGVFPATYEGLLSLPGVGPYTAAAIASFAYDWPVAVLDGNVFRILARYAADATPIDTGPGKKHFQKLADLALGQTSARRFNQAIMDFGALVCTPRKAACGECPVREGCQARAKDVVYELPVKSKKLKRRERFFHYLVIEDNKGRVLIEQRTDKDIWQDLYQFPLVEVGKKGLLAKDLLAKEGWPAGIPAAEVAYQRSSPPYQQQLTHQKITVRFHRFRWENMPNKVKGGKIIKNKKLREQAFPRVITRFLDDKSLLLDLF